MKIKMLIITGILWLSACREEKGSKQDIPVIKESSPAVTDQSLYQVNSRWVTDKKDTITLGDLGPNPQLLAMVYTSCDYACPRILQEFRNIENAISSKIKGKLGRTLVTIDPEKDTPEALKAYRGKMKLDENWTLLNGKEEDILELAVLLGMKYKKRKDGHFSHSNLITLLNSKGEIAYQKRGLGETPESMVKSIKKLFNTD